MQKFPHRFAAAPNHNLRRPVARGLVETADQGGQNMAVLRMKIIPRSIEIRWHHTAIIHAILPVITFAKFNARDLGDGIRLVRGLKRASQQGLFRHRLRRVTRIDTRAAQLQQLLNPRRKRLMDHIAFDHQVFVNELSRICIVRHDPANLGCGEDHHIRCLRTHEVTHRRLIGQVQFRTGARHQLQRLPSILARL